MGIKLIQSIFIGILLLMLQMLLFNKLVIWNGIVAYIYILFLIRLPYSIPNSVSILIGFIVGLLVDLTLNSGGVHASASVVIMGVRQILLRAMLGKEMDSESHPSISRRGLNWYLTYAGILVAIHQFWFNVVETFFQVSFGYFLSRFIGSTIFTLFIIILFDSLIEAPKKKKY